MSTNWKENDVYLFYIKEKNSITKSFFFFFFFLIVIDNICKTFFYSNKQQIANNTLNDAYKLANSNY